MRPRKRFGQHFLHDPAVLNQIATSVSVRDDDPILEIGPGHGALTEYIYRPGLSYTAIEIDRDLIAFLSARFPKIDVLNEDILRVDLAALLAGQRWRLIGNLPYNISTPLLMRCAEVARTDTIRDMHFMLQKEMAERLSAIPGTKAWGRLSITIQLLCTVEYLFDVAPSSFTPAPKVWSGVVRLIPRSDAIDETTQRLLNGVLTAAFSGRRKRLSNSLKAFAIDWEQIDLDPGLRADNVSAQQYLDIARVAESQRP
jgi:16S rRNA (adenine1518-N6/adenine1519-N6)-dimethyltransferase